MPGRLSNRVAIVTGASSGIGRAIALAYHREGAHLVCADLQPSARAGLTETGEKDTATHEAIAQDGGKAVFAKCDVTSAADVEALVARAVEEFGRVDVVVNNAGIAVEAYDPRPVWEVSEETWDKTLAINGKGVFLGCKYASKQMMMQEPLESGDRGWIINIASIHGLGGLPNLASYTSSKHAVVGLTKVVALDCAPYRIHCNAICPGYTATAMTTTVFGDQNAMNKLTPMHPFRGLGEPEDIAAAAVTLASADARWITGVSLPVDGGYMAI